MLRRSNSLETNARHCGRYIANGGRYLRASEVIDRCSGKRTILRVKKRGITGNEEMQLGVKEAGLSQVIWVKYRSKTYSREGDEVHAKFAEVTGCGKVFSLDTDKIREVIPV
jgi:hypothetical protein